jgi:hypothetical protein
MMYLYGPHKELLGAINTFGRIKDVGYIVEVMKKCLIEVGPQNIVQVCMDNASVMHKAVSIVQEDWLPLYFQRCMVHALNLLL